MMFERLDEAVAKRMSRVAEDELRRIEAGLEAVPGVRAVRDGDRLVIEGLGLARRRIEDPRLRWGHR